MSDEKTIAVVDDDPSVRYSAVLVLEMSGRKVEGFASGDLFLKDGRMDWGAVFLDLKMPGRSGFEVLSCLAERGPRSFPVIMVSAHGDVKAAVQAMKLGAASFVEKPFTAEELIGALEDAEEENGRDERVDELLSSLTPRERDVALLLNDGLTNKEVARKLDCSPRTVEIHRSRVLSKLEVRNVAGLVRALAGQSPNP
ncbi:MAG: response regulator [Parvularcula sp.]|jgi:two-component system response regulator FixJ|nr:response regulator [Parvularcula sp.]